MDEKLKSTIDKVVKLTKQNPEFDQELRKALEIKPSANVALCASSKQIDEIYEYCISVVNTKQAQNFYANFPLSSICNQLVADYIRMEEFRRKNNFGDFSLACYQQVENIINTLINTPNFVEAFKNVINNVVYGDKTIAKTIWGKDIYLTDGIKRIQENKLSAKDKVKIIIYTLNHWEKFNISTYKLATDWLLAIYSCRNLNHRGGFQSDKDKKTTEQCKQDFTYSYHMFTWALSHLVDSVKMNQSKIAEVIKYSQNKT